MEGVPCISETDLFGEASGMLSIRKQDPTLSLSPWANQNEQVLRSPVLLSWFLTRKERKEAE